MHTTAVIPNWNGGAMLRQMLESAVGQQGAGFDRILIIDNGSNETPEWTAGEFGAEIIRLDRNYGFAKAVNEGIRACASSDWVAILNNDIVLAPDWLTRLTASADKADYLGGKLLQLSDKSRIDGGYDLVSRSGVAWRAGQGRGDGPEWSRPRTGCIIPLTAALFRRDVFERVGMLDEQFGSYLEDVDLGLRCINAGLTGRYVPDAIAWHAGSGTLGAWSPEMVRLLSKNQVLIARKYLSTVPVWPKLVGQGLWGLLAIKRGTGRSWLRGKIEGLQEKIVAFACRQAVNDFVLASEREIASLQSGGDSDSFWRVYFRLTGGSDRD